MNPHGMATHQGKLVFAPGIAHLPLSALRRCAARHDGESTVKSVSCLARFYAMAFAQLTFRASLRGIEASLVTQGHRLHHHGFRPAVARHTLASANALRPWQVCADLAQQPTGNARPFYANEPIGPGLRETVQALDVTTIDLGLSVCPWAPFRATNAAVKLHTLLDVRGSIPTFIHIRDGRMREVNVLDALTLEPGAFHGLDRGHMDFGRPAALDEAGSFFRIRAKRGLRFKCRYSKPVDRTNTRVLCDRMGTLKVHCARQAYPSALCRVVVTDQNGKRITPPSNPTTPAPKIAGELYRLRWQVELCFKWIKRHLRTKAFFGTPGNAVQTRIWSAIATRVLIAIVKKRALLPHRLYKLLHVLKLTMFETTPIRQLLTTPRRSPPGDSGSEQLVLH